MKRLYATMCVLLLACSVIILVLWVIRSNARRSDGPMPSLSSGSSALETVASESIAREVVVKRDAGVEGAEVADEKPPKIVVNDEALVNARNEQVGLNEKSRAVKMLTVESGADEVAEAIAAAKEDPSLKAAVVQALGQVRSEAARAYVREAMNDEDSGVACVAVATWADLTGEEGVGDIGKVMAANRIRKTGPRDEVAVTCVRALGSIMSPEALPILEQELQWAVQREARPVYGVDLIEAVVDIGDSRGAAMLEGHADTLQGKLSGQPMVRREQMLQIGMARLKAADLR